jgi:uncharacterized protein (TIGR01777 family)
MRIVVTGGTGFLGRALIQRLQAEHELVVFTRRRTQSTPVARSGQAAEVQWSPGAAEGQWLEAVHSAHAVVNLAGEPIAAGRWTDARKRAIHDSRVAATRAIVDAIRTASTPPILINGSAIGIYGDRGDETLTEESSLGTDFLAGVCRDWEAEAMKAADRTRVVSVRTGFVMSKDGGALPQFALPFRFFAGGPAGSGRQYMSWIHVDDWVEMVRFALMTPTIQGPVNATAPEPVTNAEFARTLGRALRRPAVVAAPAFALRLALGEMADALILGGQRVLPAKGESLGFSFRYATLDAALAAVYWRA